MKVSVFIGTSLDGFIARLNGDLDFLPPGGGELHGYDEFIASRCDCDRPQDLRNRSHHEALAVW